MITWPEQIKILNNYHSFHEAVEANNKMIEPCKPKPKIWGIFPRRLITSKIILVV